MQQGIKELQWFEYLTVVFLEILNAELCWVFANQVTYVRYKDGCNEIQSRPMNFTTCLYKETKQSILLKMNIA